MVNILNPIGKYPDSAICESVEHNWEILFLNDRKFRTCKRCDRQERQTIENKWEVNEIKPSIA